MLVITAAHVRKKEDDKSVSFTLSVQNKNYFLKVCENKEVGRLVSVLSSSINSAKKVFILNIFYRFVISVQLSDLSIVTFSYCSNS